MEVFKFETTPTGLQGDAHLPPVGIDAKSRSANFPDSGKVEFAGFHVEMSGDQIKEVRDRRKDWIPWASLF